MCVCVGGGGVGWGEWDLTVIESIDAGRNQTTTTENFTQKGEG